jgi:LPS-assembly protein
MPNKVRSLLLISGCSLGMALSLASVVAQQTTPQVLAPNRRVIFQDDNPEFVQGQRAQRRAVASRNSGSVGDTRFSAGDVQFDQTSKEMVGKSGIAISRPGMSASADSARYNSESGAARLDGGVRFFWAGGSVSAKDGTFNVKNETGEFHDADLLLEEGEFRILSRELKKLTEFDYAVKESEFSTCNCPDGSLPWSIVCSGGTVEQEGYAHLRDTKFLVNGVPVFYSPYLAFPVKTQRASGLLVPEWGYSNRDGVTLWQPIFVVLDNSSDVLLTPFVETNTRYGSRVDYRQVFSPRSDVSARLLYSDESPRGSDLRGTRVDDIFDKDFDTHRVGAALTQNWKTRNGAAIPSSFAADGHYVSDALLPREIQDDRIALNNSRFASSRAVWQSSYAGVLFGEFSSEYNQALLSDPDVTFHRLPEASLSAQDTFRPFGFNPYGIKVQAGLSGDAVRFDRDKGYEGGRTNISPSVKVPWHVKNYINGQLGATGYFTQYSLDNQQDPVDPTIEYNDDKRDIFQFSNSVSTGLEKVYDVNPDGTLSWMTRLGARNQAYRLKRVKHTIEPTAVYQYVPVEDQSAVPLFDPLDRISPRNLIGGGVKTRLLGRFAPRFSGSDSIPEIAPRVEDLPAVGVEQPFQFFGGSFNNVSNQVQLNRGEIRELANLSVMQNFDYEESKSDRDPTRDAWSDTQIDTSLFPTNDLGFNVMTNYDAESQSVTSWSFGTHFLDDRGDALRARYSYIDGQIGQLETGLEVVLLDKLRLGSYGRFDERTNKFIETNTILRFMSDCRCWSFDIGYGHTTNPDRDKLLFTVNLLGLGGLRQQTSVTSLANPPQAAPAPAPVATPVPVSSSDSSSSDSSAGDSGASSSLRTRVSWP